MGPPHLSSPGWGYCSQGLKILKGIQARIQPGGDRVMSGKAGGNAGSSTAGISADTMLWPKSLTWEGQVLAKETEVPISKGNPHRRPLAPLGVLCRKLPAPWQEPCGLSLIIRAKG